MIRIRMVAFAPTPALLTALLLSWLATAPAGFASSFGQLDGNPNLRSASALVIGADGNLIYGKDIDTVRPDRLDHQADDRHGHTRLRDSTWPSRSPSPRPTGTWCK